MTSGLDTGSPTEWLARSSQQTAWSHLSPVVRHQAKRSLINFFAVALAGARDPTIKVLIESLSQFTGAGESTVIGTGRRLNRLDAACVNAAGANVFDFCDTDPSTAIHPTATIAAALLSHAEAAHTSGEQLLLALIIGHEVACRVGRAISPSHYDRGWHITSTCGVIGTAAAAAKLLQLDATATAHAIAIATNQAAGLCECLGTAAKSVGVGNAARNGLWSAYLAAKGLQGPREPLNGVQGYFAALSGPVDLAKALTPWGDAWAILDTAYKPYPCGFVVHPVLDCVLDWRREHPHVAVDGVVVRGNPLLVLRTDRPSISTGRESQVSVQHAVAAALVRLRAGIAEFTDACVYDAEIASLRGRVKVIADEAIPVSSAEVEIVSSDGKRFVLFQRDARGTAANPLTDGDLEAKLVASSPTLGLDGRPLIESIWNLERQDDVAATLKHAVAQ